MSVACFLGRTVRGSDANQPETPESVYGEAITNRPMDRWTDWYEVVCTLLTRICWEVTSMPVAVKSALKAPVKPRRCIIDIERIEHIHIEHFHIEHIHIERIGTKVNKAVYTTASVTYGWSGALIRFR